MALRIEYLPTAQLRPYERNARIHSESQIDAIAESIRQFGFNSPILIGDDNGVIAGHARLAAACKLGLDTVPCVRLSHLNDAQRRAYILADNRLAEMASWDEELLKSELLELSILDTKLDLSFLDFNFDDLLPEEESNEKNQRAEGGKLHHFFEVSVICKDEQEQKAVYEHLTGLGYKCRVLSI